jgi:hypothetical protein
MKSLLISFALLFSISSAYATPAAPASKASEPEKVKVCVDVKDKDGKPVKDAKGNVKQNCKEMKAHKKLEGTQVPPTPPKK